MYEKVEDEAERFKSLSALGFTKEDLNDETEDSINLWPENVEAFVLFNDISTQWRIGMSGATGLDYNVLFHKMDRLKLSDEDYQALETDIRTMEYAALKEIRNSENK